MLRRALLGRVRGAALLLCAALACRDRHAGARPPVAGAPASAPGTDSARKAAAAESVAAARDQWNDAEVVKRLTEAGLVVSDRGVRVKRAGITAPGERLAVSGSELEIYVFDSADDRRRSSATLDTSSRADSAIPPAARPRYIVSNNLIAVLLTTNDRLAERVTDALKARHGGEERAESKEQRADDK